MRPCGHDGECGKRKIENDMAELDIDRMRREWSEMTRRVEREAVVPPEMLRRSMRSDAAVLRRYGWVNLVGGVVVIPFVLWYVAEGYGFGAFFWLLLAGLAAAAVFSVYQIAVYYRAGRVDRGVVQHAETVVRYMRVERIMTVAVYAYMFCLLMYMLVENIFGKGGAGDAAVFVRCLAASLAIFAAGVFVSWRIMRWEHGRLRRLNEAVRQIEEFLGEGEAAADEDAAAGDNGGGAV